MLGGMTKEWSTAAVSMAKYILTQRASNPNIAKDHPISIYNKWLNLSGYRIANPDLAVRHVYN